MEKNFNRFSSLTSNPLVAVVAGVLVVIIGFSLYSYLAKNPVRIEKGQITEKAASEIANDKPKELETLGTGGADTPERPIEWYAIDYRQGDISGQKYEVKEGDTLWEIAEARYGSGFEWGKILDANSGDIGWLTNGNPLISPGQILVLPD